MCHQEWKALGKLVASRYGILVQWLSYSFVWLPSCPLHMYLYVMYVQVTEDTYHILRLYGYTFEQRGLVTVKGKGQLMTYYLIGKGKELSDEKIQNMIQETWPSNKN